MRYYFVIYTDYNGERKAAVVPKERVATEKHGMIRPSEAPCTKS